MQGQLFIQDHAVPYVLLQSALGLSLELSYSKGSEYFINILDTYRFYHGEISLHHMNHLCALNSY